MSQHFNLGANMLLANIAVELSLIQLILCS